MLLPFEFAVITVQEARLLMEFIEKQTATKSISKNYEKMQKLGVMEMYDKLCSFVGSADHYEHELRTVETWRFVTRDDD